MPTLHSRKVYTKIKYLFLNNNEITTAQAANLIQGLKGSSVISLKLASNKIDEVDINELVEVLEKTDIATLDLRDNSLPYWCLGKFRHISPTALAHLNVEHKDQPFTPSEKERLQRRVPFLKWAFSSDITPLEDPFLF